MFHIELNFVISFFFEKPLKWVRRTGSLGNDFYGKFGEKVSIFFKAKGYSLPDSGAIGQGVWKWSVKINFVKTKHSPEVSTWSGWEMRMMVVWCDARRCKSIFIQVVLLKCKLRVINGSVTNLQITGNFSFLFGRKKLKSTTYCLMILLTTQNYCYGRWEKKITKNVKTAFWQDAHRCRPLRHYTLWGNNNWQRNDVWSGVT